jgi:ABC-2 type transport system permease protein
LIGALLTAMVMSREWERGTMEALLVTPLSMSEVMVGKLMPYFMLGMGGLALSVGDGGVLLRGAAARLAGGAHRDLQPVHARRPRHGAVDLHRRAQPVRRRARSPSSRRSCRRFILSGFVFDINSMPWFVQVITHVVAARYFVAILQTTFLAGDVWSVILPNAAALIAMAAIFLGVARALARKRLD